MKQEDIDKKIGMPDVDAEWANFEREVINPKTASRKTLYWGIGIAASIALAAGIFLFGDNTEKSQQTIAQQNTHTIQTSSAEKTIVETPVESIASPEKDEPVRIETKQRPSTELLAEATPPTTEEKVYDCGEVMPYFPGGDRALLEFVKNNLRYPDLAMEYGVRGRVVMTFKVDTIGQVSNIKPARFQLRYDTLYMNRVPAGHQVTLKQQIDSLLSKECTRILCLMPRWTPGSLFGETVSVKYSLPVQFNATDAERQTYLAQKQAANDKPQDHIAGLTIEPTLADHIAGQDNPQHSERQVSDVKIVGSDSVGTLKFLTNYAEGKKLAEHLLIPVDSASESWQEKHKRGAFYDKLRTRLMMPKHVAFGMGCEPSRSNEWSLYYDSVAHALIYSKAEKNIYWATRDALYKEKKIGKDRYQRVLRKHPKSLKKLKVKSYSMPITNEQAQRLKTMWTEAIGCAETKKSFALDGTKIEFPLGTLRAKTPKGVNPLVTFTNELAEAVYANDVLHKDSLLAESTLKKCLADAKEAVKPVQFNYDSLIIIADKQQLPDSLCKLIRNRVRQYYHQQGLMVATWQDWSAYGAKFHSGYDKNCPLMELTTVPDTLSDAYISQHPALQQSLHHITGIVLSEDNEPIPDAWVGVYGEGAGAPTDSAGHFSFWLPRKDVTIQASCLGYITVRITQPADTTLTIRMKSAVRIREVKVIPKKEREEYIFHE